MRWGTNYLIIPLPFTLHLLSLRCRLLRFSRCRLHSQLLRFSRCRRLCGAGRLQLEAALVAGAVHIILGNHEIMNAGLDFRFVAESG